MSARAVSSSARWTLSFADLCLVLVACLLMLNAGRGSPAAMAAGVRSAFGAPPAASWDRAAAELFEPGEAILRAPERAALATLGANAARTGAAVSIESRGRDAASRRFDGWELAAARAAAVARAIAEGGLDQRRIDVSVAGTREAAGAGQRLRVTTVPARALAG